VALNKEADRTLSHSTLEGPGLFILCSNNIKAGANFKQFISLCNGTWSF